MNIIGKRIKDLRKALKITQKQIADYVGVNRVSVSQWESQGDSPTQPKGENLIRLSQILKTTPDYILYGVEPGEENTTPKDEISNTEPTWLRPHKDLPIVSWVQAGETHVAFVEDDLENVEKFRTYEKCSPNSYALRVSGDSMTTMTGPYSFPEGSIIVVDPEQRGDTTDGVFIIAKKEGEDAVNFKQLKYDGGSPYLNSLNPDYERYFGKIRIIGKVIDFRPVRLP